MSETKSPLRGAIAFLIGCVTSPCCTPLYVPLLLVMFVGTPFAAWMGQNVGWVYAGLALISLASFVLALRWLNGRPRAQMREPVGKHSAIIEERKGS